jgi:hypothetical protein
MFVFSHKILNFSMVEHHDDSLFQELNFHLRDLCCEKTAFCMYFPIDFDFSVDDDGERGLVVVD